MTDRPIRVHLSRAKGWRMPPNTVKVSRPGLLGNPYIIGRQVSDAASARNAYRIDLERAIAHPDLVSSKWQRRAAVLPELRGKNLACWCKPGTPCHADVLIELANR
ncbi:DUF4326 domain-containing protein [Sandarakinorhabdus sp. DWP1-3-1]|uniref:DUF4326 domain-containing protein n=1 Tax=Sandarakinorhabdus sp. DWP1-3-1 TaxID=2804627 RepID=UPI003CEFCB6F